MDSLIFTINAVMPLFILVLLGFILRRIGIFSGKWLETANKFSFRITLFALMFYNIYSDNGEMEINARLIAFAFLSLFVILALSYIIVPFIVKDRFRTGVVIQGIFRSNLLLFGMPLVINMFGDSVRPMISLLVALVIPAYNLIAVITLTFFNKNTTNKIDFIKIAKGIITNPLILGSITGFVFKGFSIPLPSFILSPVSDLANMAVPLALIIVGGQFRINDFKLNIKTVLSVTFIKMILIPFLVLIIAIALGFNGIELAILVAMFCSPCAVSSSIMAYNMNCDGDLAGHIVVIGTLFSVFSMFITIYILRVMALI